MNALIVHFSKFGNTRLVAEAIADGLAANGTARVLTTDQLTPADLQDADLVILGTPTHNMNLPEDVRPILQDLPKRILQGASVAAFDTSYRMSGFLARFTAAKRLDRKLRKLGGKRVAPPETFFVEGREGPLEEGEVERAKAWAASILAGMQAQPAA